MRTTYVFNSIRAHRTKKKEISDEMKEMRKLLN
jgi:hypothetical protein